MRRDGRIDTSITAGISRRHFLVGCAATFGMCGLSPAFAHTLSKRPERDLSFLNLHTGERLKVTYWADGDFVSESLSEINHLLRDFRTGDIHRIDPRLLDILYGIKEKVGTRKEFHIISGYRSPKTNHMLRAKSGGVAKRSLHMQGKALDIRLPGRDIRTVHRAAKSLKAGGVGLYTKSNFVHVDTGRVRYW